MSKPPSAPPAPAQSAATALPTDEQLYRQGNRAYKTGDMEGSCRCYRQALALNPAHPIAWLNLSLSLRRLGHTTAAYGCIMRARELAPDDPVMLTNLGNLLVDFNRLDEALACHDRAVALKPDDARLAHNRIIALREACAFERHLAACDAFLRTAPDDRRILWERAQALFYLQRLPEAWRAFEGRWHRSNIMQKMPAGLAHWQGEDLSGRSILVHEEQGFGDNLLCSRYIPLLVERGAEVTLLCNPALHDLLSPLPARISMIAENAERFDYAASMMSLPGLFGTDPAHEPPPPPPSLQPATDLPASLQHLLDLGRGRRKIGIVWSGNPQFIRNHKRAATIEHFLPLTHLPDVQLYSLQKGELEGDIARVGASGLIIELAPHLENFAQTAAVLQQLDLVIMTDSSVAHLAGSLNVPIWNLLDYCPYWIYGLKGSTTPWYPSMRLFRQSEPGDWDSVFLAVTEALKAPSS